MDAVSLEAPVGALWADAERQPEGNRCNRPAETVGRNTWLVRCPLQDRADLADKECVSDLLEAYIHPIIVLPVSDLDALFCHY
jgi:hypothetical protein